MKFFVCGMQPTQAVRLVLSLLLFLSLLTTSGLAQNSNQPNSVVRFEFIRGTNALGMADVELFDHEKPETVRNFLLYVRSGAYTNSFLHRCVPGFVVQGGGFSVTNPSSSDRFGVYNSVTNYGRLTNEFLVGARMSNVLGTIAMAKVGNDPDSATSQWFFNLGNNTTNLDSQNGGFTVFGRILEAANTNDGVNVLEHFNRLSTNAGVVNLGSLIGPSYQVFSSLPVSYTNTITRVPLNRELYYVRISLLNDTKVPGTNAPSVLITSPGPNSVFTNQAVTIQGTASDDSEVARVVYRIGDGAREAAVGTTNWQATFQPSPGFQAVTVESIDWDGNFSSSASINLFYQSVVPLALQVTGNGTVSGLTDGQLLVAGSSYTATATPKSGSIFEGWTGSITSATPTLTFSAPTNATNFTLTAKFIIDPTPQLAGTYHGLLQPLGPMDFDGAGFMALTLRSDGGYSGSLLYHGVTYYYNGQFDSTGNSTLIGLVGGTTRTISLTLQKLNSAGVITGTFSGTASTTFVQLERLALSLPAADSPGTGGYTFAIPSAVTNLANTAIPAGHGFGTGTIAANGTFTLNGTLGDGTAFTASPKVSRLGKWPLYLDLDGGKGALWGWISYNTNPPAKLQATLNWIRTASGSAPTYPSGFSNQVPFTASAFAVEPGQRVVNWVHGMARISGTDLPYSLTNFVKLSTNNVVEVLQPSQSSFQLNLDTSSGLVNGSFVHPWFGTTNSLMGSLVVASNYIRGQYANGSQVGSFMVDVSPYLITQAISSVTLPALEAAMSEGGVLQFQGDGLIVVTNALKARFNTRLEANGHSVIISGGGTTRLFEVPTNNSFAMVGLVLTDGFHQGAAGANGTEPGAGGDGVGGAILNLGGGIALTNCIITNCVVLGGDAGLDSSTNEVQTTGGRALGAALYSIGGPVSLKNCSISNNVARAGGNRSIATAGAVSKGAAMGMGAALFSDGGECIVLDCILQNNLAQGGEPLPLPSGAAARAGNGAGGAIAIAAGSLRLLNSSVYTNTALAYTSTNAGGSGHAYAGAIFLETNVTAIMQNSTFSWNTALAGGFDQTTEPPNASGGAIYSGGSLALTNCSLAHNNAQAGASSPAGNARGGAVASQGPVVVYGSTFSGNIARGGTYDGIPASSVAGGEGAGGAIHLSTTSLSVTNSTFAYNAAVGGAGANAAGQTNATRGSARGGAVALSSSSASLSHVTISANEASEGAVGAPGLGGALGGGLANQTGAITLRSSILSSNLPANFSGAVTDHGYNISSDASSVLPGLGSLTNRDAMLTALSANGGATLTMAILPESPARDAVRGTFPTIDQRGTTRPQGTYADSGAFEYVQILPIVTLQPSGTNLVRYGTNFAFQATASGPGPIGYYWLKDQAPLTGVTSNILTLLSVQPLDAGKYSAVATNAFGATTSSVATLVVDLRPFIVTQPVDVVIAPGASTALVITATGPSLNYTWYRNQTPVPGGNSASLPILNAAPGAEGNYQVIITNNAGSVTSRVTSVTWGSAALAILAQPQNQTVGIGKPISLMVLASGVTPITYQWYKDNVPITGATSNSLYFAEAARTNSAVYKVSASNPFLTLTSANAVVTVVASPLVSIVREPTTVAITCFGDPGRVHRLLSASNLAGDAVWTQVGSQTMPGGGSFTWRFPRGTNAEPVYYRAVTP